MENKNIDDRRMAIGVANKLIDWKLEEEQSEVWMKEMFQDWF